MSSVTLAFVIVVSAGYMLHSKLTFRAPLTIHSFTRYAIAMAGNIPLAFVITWLWHDLARLPMIWAAPLATSSMIPFNFVLSRWAIGSRKSAWWSWARS